MWDRLNLPMLLFKEGLLTLMLMDSFMFLAKPVRPDEVHSSGWKLVFNQDQCTVPEIITILQDSTNSMRNLHQLLLQEDGIEAWCLLRIWEKLQLRASEYKNHRIFTLRCIHNDLVPSSIKLKSTRANQILRIAEKDLLQARVKSINYILDQTSKQLEECRSKLATIVSTQKLRECQDFVDKVGETRFNKV